MADALAKYRAALKRYCKEHPNTNYRTAQKAVSAAIKSGKVSGPKKRRKAGTAPKKRATVGATRTRRTNPAPAKKAAAKRTPSALQRARTLLRKIEVLELKRKNEKAREMKDIIQIEINRTHDKLDALRKRKSA